MDEEKACVIVCEALNQREESNVQVCSVIQIQTFLLDYLNGTYNYN